MSVYLKRPSLLIATTANVRYYTSRIQQAKDNYVARLAPKRILNASKLTPNFESEEKIEKISEAVQRYLANYKQNAEIFDERNREFELGKRHLANIMGYDPNHITQEQIDHAIKYLFPSGLFQVKYSLPVMKPPAQIYPKFKTASYDKSGRPFSTFFFTALPNYYENMYELYHHFEDLNRIEDENIARGIEPTEEDRFQCLQYGFKSKGQIEALFVEKLKDFQYERFMNHVRNLIDHPYSASKTEFIERFMLKKLKQQFKEETHQILIDEHGREYSQADGKRRTCECVVKVYNKGTGKFSINNQHTLNFFRYYLHREQIMSPLVMTDLVGKVDVQVQMDDDPLILNCDGVYAGAIRIALANAICPFVDADRRELLRVNGLLQRDIRKKERKKPGKHGARKSQTYRKR